MSLYDFIDLKLWVMLKFGVDADQAMSSFQPITQRMTQAELGRRVKLTARGIVYTDDDGVEHRGFLYIGKGYSRPYPDDYTGGKTTVPRFHVVNCQTILDQIRNNRYDGHYVFSEAQVEMPEYTGEMKSPLLCSNCQKIAAQIPARIDTAAFETILRDDAVRAGRFSTVQLPEVVEVLDSGYTPDWAAKSRAFREKRRFKCESCGIQPNRSYADAFYLQTHHKNGNTSDNRDANLKCLCVLCHANVDEHHVANYGTGANKRIVSDFIELYRTELLAVGNPYVR